MSIFHSYDVRAKYPSEINEDIVYRIGRATAVFLKSKKILVGRDCRTSSLSLKKSLVYGITDQGCDVVDTGYCNTPMCYYAAQKMDAIMVTASHNPPEYNGLKTCKKGVIKIGMNSGSREIEKNSNACHFKEPKKRGKVTAQNILPAYVKDVRKIIEGKFKPLKVLIDCGNGMAAYVAPALFKGLPLKIKLLYGEMDGTFPNHVANPLIAENTADLQREVVEGNYDIGVAYDADCDRMFFIDEKGRRVHSDRVLACFADKLLKKGQSVSYAVNMGKIVKETAESKGCKAYPSKIGHTEVPLIMRKHKSALGGEVSGHYYYQKFHYADSGDITALQMLSILSQSGKKMSELIKLYDKYATSEEINYKVKNKMEVLKRIEESYKKQITMRIDGLNVDAGDYWFNFRLSNTENLVRLNCEAVDQKKLRQAIEWISQIILR